MARVSAIARLAAAAAATVATACSGPAVTSRPVLVDPAPPEQGDPRGVLLRELEVEVRASYERDSLDAAAAATAIDPSVGLAAIGVGPDAIAVGTAPDERWPVQDVGGRPITIVSRGLELGLSADRTVGWAYDDLSLRLPVCDRIASIPLRIAQVWVRDSERWTLVAEHVAYAQPMGRWLDAAIGPDGVRMASARERQSESTAAQEAVAAAVAVDGDRMVWDARDDALAVWPDPLQVLRGAATRTGPSLAQSLGATAVGLEGVRVALGPTRSVAIVSTTLAAKVQRAKNGGVGEVDIRLRGTFVVERVVEQVSGKEVDAWRVRQALVSTPITTGALVGRSVGIAATVGAGGRVTITCR